jgi:D-alanyl-lipoteichoic acid acyltransferase DltB (MBOAT superfamily)
VLFNSYEFLFVFLPVAIAGYFTIARLSAFGANAFLAAASVAFYAYWKLDFVWILAASIAANYLFGRKLSREAALSRGGGRSRAVLALGIALNLALLGYFKYADFFIANFNAATGADVGFLRLALPLGISFFTFTQVAYLVDAWKGTAAEYSATNYVLFVTFFPHLLAGPIIHHREMMPQFADDRLKRIDWENMARGLVLFTLGLAKKVLVADPLAPWANAGFANAQGLSFADAWITMLAYAMQLVFDFSGYTDMALGAALMLNIRLPLNFDSPYRSADIREFWRRWHMTLSRFLRDYVYIPLGGNRRGEARMLAAAFATFVIGGFWHGAAWTFVAWGAMHGAALVVLHFWGKLGRPLPRPLAVLATALFVAMAFVVFRAASLADAWAILSSVMGFKGVGLALTVPEWSWIGRAGVPPAQLAQGLATAATLAGALALTFTPRNSNHVAESVKLEAPMPRYAFGLLLAAALVFVQNPTEFIYFIF